MSSKKSSSRASGRKGYPRNTYGMNAEICHEPYRYRHTAVLRKKTVTKRPSPKRTIPEPKIPVPGPKIPIPGPKIPIPEPKVPIPGPKIPVPEPKVPIPGPEIPGTKKVPRKFAKASNKAPVIGIIGGGLAGLTTSLELAKAGYKSIIFEGNPDRLGGRVESGYFTDAYGNSQKYEKGGELIDKSHISSLQQINSLGLEVTDLYKSTPNGTEVFYRVYDPTNPKADNNGIVAYTEEELKKDFQNGGKTGQDAPAGSIKKDTNKASYPTAVYPEPLYTDLGRELANTDMESYIDDITSVLDNDYLVQILRAAYAIEFGGETSEQSSLNMLYLIGYTGQGQFRPYGQNAEKFSVTLGNSVWIERLREEIEKMGSEIRMGWKATKVTRLDDGNYQIDFDGKGSETFERIVLATPIQVMRKFTPAKGVLNPKSDNYLDTQAGSNGDFGWNLDVSEAGFSNLKKKAILKLQPARITKTMVQYNQRVWNINGNNGDTYLTAYIDGKEKYYQNTWDSTRGQLGSKGILTFFTGGDKGEDLASSDIEPKKAQAQVNEFVEQFAITIPGSDSPLYISKDEDGNVTNKFFSRNWYKEEFARGAWSYWNPGSEAPPYSGPDNSFAGVEGAAEPIYADEDETIEVSIDDRNCHFAGEYVTADFQGYMNGAVVGGELAASQILQVFKNAKLAPNL